MISKTRDALVVLVRRLWIELKVLNIRWNVLDDILSRSESRRGNHVRVMRDALDKDITATLLLIQRGIRALKPSTELKDRTESLIKALEKEKEDAREEADGSTDQVEDGEVRPSGTDPVVVGRSGDSV